MEILGKSAGGHDINCYQLGHGPVQLLLVGGVHGDEPEGYTLVEAYLNQKLWQPIESLATIWVIPRLNPDGCLIEERRNSRGVDLNRNMPTKDWTGVAAKERYHPGPSAGSESETKALMYCIEKISPRLIVSAHSWEPMINYNGPCKTLAHRWGELINYRVSDDIGYPTPGSLGTWAGWERGIPTITLEIERHMETTAMLALHLPALAKILQESCEPGSHDPSEGNKT